MYKLDLYPFSFKCTYFIFQCPNCFVMAFGASMGQDETIVSFVNGAQMAKYCNIILFDRNPLTYGLKNTPSGKVFNIVAKD